LCGEANITLAVGTASGKHASLLLVLVTTVDAIFGVNVADALPALVVAPLFDAVLGGEPVTELAVVVLVDLVLPAELLYAEPVVEPLLVDVLALTVVLDAEPNVEPVTGLPVDVLPPEVVLVPDPDVVMVDVLAEAVLVAVPLPVLLVETELVPEPVPVVLAELESQPLNSNATQENMIVDIKAGSLNAIESSRELCTDMRITRAGRWNKSGIAAFSIFET
jgi:hypothetical protein